MSHLHSNHILLLTFAFIQKSKCSVPRKVFSILPSCEIFSDIKVAYKGHNDFFRFFFQERKN